MNVAIAGDGIAGSYLVRVLNKMGHQAHFFGIRHRTRCGIRPCGFGISGAGVELLRSLGIDPPVVSHHDAIVVSGRPIPGDLYSIDKPELIRRLRGEHGVSEGDLVPEKWDRVIDATGLARAYSPKVPLKTAANVQVRVRGNDTDVPRFDVIQGGYIWYIPVGGETHIGAGSSVLTESTLRALLKGATNGRKVVCACSANINISGPIYPLVNGRVWTVGEAAGAVVPLGGAGIHPALLSAMALARTFDSPSRYQAAVQRQLGFLDGCRKALDRMENNGRLNLTDALRMRRALWFQGMFPGVLDLLYIRSKVKLTWGRP